MNFLQVRRLSKQLQQNEVVKNISFEQAQGKKLAIAGETGSGKSTLLKMIAGLVQPTSGQVFFKDERVLGPDEQLLPGHRGIAYLSQYFELRNNYRVEELLEYANKWPEADANEIFEICQVSHLLKRRTDEISGGEKQRIAAARLLIGSPQLLILDEPYSNLDLAHKNTLKNVIADAAKKLDITCILTSHDPEDVLSWADEIIVLHNGQIVETGTAEKIYSHPGSEYVAGLFGKFNQPSLALLYQLHGDNPLHLNVLPDIYRPEQLEVSHQPVSDVEGMVTQVQFLGNHWLLQVAVNNEPLWVITTKPGWKVQQRAYVFLKTVDVI